MSLDIDNSDAIMKLLDAGIKILYISCENHVLNLDIEVQ